MSEAPKSVLRDEIAFYFQTNDAIPAGLLANFILEIERAALAPEFLGYDTVLEIVEVSKGSTKVRLRAILQDLANLAALGALGYAVADYMKEDENKIAVCVGCMVVDHHVTQVQVITSEDVTTIKPKDMPVVARLESERHAARSAALDEAYRAGQAAAERIDLERLVEDARTGRLDEDVGAYINPAPTNIPGFGEEAVIKGLLANRGSDLILVQADGSQIIVEAVKSPQPPPLGVEISIKVTAVRGERGGWPDLMVQILDWWHGDDASRARADQDRQKGVVPSRGLILIEGTFHLVGPDVLFRDNGGRTFAFDPSLDSTKVPLGGRCILAANETDEFTEDGLPVLDVVRIIRVMN